MLINLTQKILWIILKPTLGFFIKYKIKGKDNLKVKEPVIIAMNHKSALDAFLFGVNLPINSPLWPMRFFVAGGNFKTPLLNILYDFGILSLVYFVFGHFKIKKGVALNENLKEAKNFLKNSKKGSVFIFPEGERIFEKNKIGKGKRGVAALAILSKRKVLPVAIKNSENRNIFNLRKSPVILNIGKPFYVQDMGGSKNEKYEKETDFIMNNIKKLYFDI